MKTNGLYILAAALFVMAAILQFTTGNENQGYVALIAGVSFVLAAIHWLRQRRRRR